jgi:hypothetical protein
MLKKNRPFGWQKEGVWISKFKTISLQNLKPQTCFILFLFSMLIIMEFWGSVYANLIPKANSCSIEKFRTLFGHEPIEIERNCTNQRVTF